MNYNFYRYHLIEQLTNRRKLKSKLDSEHVSWTVCSWKKQTNINEFVVIQAWNLNSYQFERWKKRIHYFVNKIIVSIIDSWINAITTQTYSLLGIGNCKLRHLEKGYLSIILRVDRRAIEVNWVQCWNARFPIIERLEFGMKLMELIEESQKAFASKRSNDGGKQIEANLRQPLNVLEPY